MQSKDDESSSGASHATNSSAAWRSTFSDSQSQAEDSLTDMDESFPSTPESGSLTSVTGRDNSWHYNFTVPWSKMSSDMRKRLEKEERPSSRERREAIRVIVAEILAVCKKPGKKHIIEIARKMVLDYPKSFRDEIEGEIVGSGYDSIVKQMMCRVDNYRRLESPCVKKRVESHSSEAEDNPKRQCKDAYGCINPDPQLPAGETIVMQKQKKEELVKMFQSKDKDTKKIEKLMTATFASQRKDILNGQKDTVQLIKEWPYLFQATGMKIHFKELTGVQISESFEEATANKFRRIFEYFQSLPTDRSSRAGNLMFQIRSGGDTTCGAVLMLLAHFKDKQEKMFVHVDDTTIASEIDTTKLPETPCIVVCGRSNQNDLLIT